MSIINKGILNSKTAFLRQVGNDWPTAQVVSTAEIIEASSNLYFTNTRVLNAVTIGTIPGSIAVTGNLVANGLIIRNINVSDSVLSGNVVAGTSTSNVILADSVTSNTWNRLYTANVIETSGNLYFTNARVVSALIPGTAITIEANGRISSTSSTVVTVVNDSIVITTASNISAYSMGRIITDPKNILVIAEGLIQIPTIDYTVSGNSLILTSNPPDNTNVEVRFFGTDTPSASTSLIATTNTFVGNGSNTQYTLTVTPPSKDYLTVIIDGVAQLSDAYSVSGTTLTFTEPPASNASIDVKLITTTVSAVGVVAGQNISVDNGVVSANVVGALKAGSSIIIESNGRISSTATGGGTSSDFNPISFMLAGM